MPNELANTEARVNITWNGQNGDLPDPVHYDSADGDVMSWAAEAVRNGDVAGIRADANVDFSNYVIDRFAATEDRPWNQINIRPKTPFGA